MADAVGGFLPVFEQKLDLLKKRLRDEMEKKKSERSKHALKHLIKEVRRVEKFVHEQRKNHTNKCPHCGEVL